MDGLVSCIRPIRFSRPAEARWIYCGGSCTSEMRRLASPLGWAGFGKRIRLAAIMMTRTQVCRELVISSERSGMVVQGDRTFACAVAPPIGSRLSFSPYVPVQSNDYWDGPLIIKYDGNKIFIIMPTSNIGNIILPVLSPIPITSLIFISYSIEKICMYLQCPTTGRLPVWPTAQD
jgi:hypothetical protein